MKWYNGSATKSLVCCGQLLYFDEDQRHHFPLFFLYLYLSWPQCTRVTAQCCILRRFCLMALSKYGQELKSLDKNSQVWTRSDKFGQEPTRFDDNRQLWTETDKFRNFLTTFIHEKWKVWKSFYTNFN